MRIFFGLTLVLVGVLIILHNFDYIDLDWDHIWPSILIIIGIGLIIRAAERHGHQKHIKRSHSRIFGDTVYEPTGELENLSFSHFIGDVELNLMRSRFRPGVTRINTSVFIGSIRIYLPDDIALKTDCSVALGDVTILESKKSGFGPSIDFVSPDYDTSQKKLMIAGGAFIGDIRIRRLQPASGDTASA